MKKLITFQTVFFVLIAISASAQDYEITEPESLNVGHLGIYAAGAVPSSDFKNAIDNGSGGIGAGLGANLVVSPYGRRRYSPLMLGVDFNYVSFGRDKVEETTSAPAYKTSFNYYTISGMGRLMLTRGAGITPFVDGLIGLKIYNTRTKIDKDAWQTVINKEQPEVIATNNDSGLTYGAGVGFFVRKDSNNAKSANGSFSLRALYLWGDEIGYVKRGSVVVDPTTGTVNFEKGYSKTSVFLIQLGIYIF